MTREQAHALTEKILSMSKFPECDVSITEWEEAYIRFANNGITTSGFVVQRSINIQSTRDRRTGSAAINDTDESALRAAVSRSEDMAAVAPENQEYIEPLGPQEYPKLDKFHEETAQARSPVMIPHIRTIIASAIKSNLQAAGFFTRSADASAIANKKGLFGFHTSTDSRLSTTIRKPDGTSSGWASQTAMKISDIDGAVLADRAVEKCLAWQKPKRLEPGKYTVVLEPTATADLVGPFSWQMGARDADEGRSFLSKQGGGTHLGEKLFPEIVTLRSDPFDARLPAMPFAGWQIPNRRIPWIEKGVVRNLEYDRYWAAKTSKQPTPRPSALVLEGSDASVEDLIRATDRGLLVTHFWYIRFLNPQTLQLTGLTRDGLFLIENGKVTTPVMNFRFNESPVRLLQNTKQLGRPVRAGGSEGGSMLAPPLRADEFNFASVSDAV
jgi:predicted Zn-dependent protease